MKPIWFTAPVLVGAMLAATVSFAGDPATAVVKDRVNYFPNRKHVPVKGTAIGILLADGQPILSTEGRSGPADQLVFSTGGNSYRWIYVRTGENPQITNLQVPAGENGQNKQVYPALNLANPASVAVWNVTKPYTLVELEVNSGSGSPANDSFVATNCRVLEGTKEYPLKTAEVVKEVKDRYAEFVKKNQDAVERAMKETAAKALNGKPPTGPREKAELMYVTWLPDTKTLRVHFKTTVSDGAYTTVGGGAPPRLPLPAKGALRVAPPRNFQIKVGTTFGVEFGQAYVVDKEGKVIRTEELPIEPFTRHLNPPPGVRPGLPPRPGVPPAPIQNFK